MREIRERVEKELKLLEHELRYEIPKEIEKATALGDLRENAEYHAALDRQRFLQARVGQLQQRLAQLATIKLSSVPRDRVGFGSIVTLEDLDTEQELVYELVIPDEGDPNQGKVSITSPIGKALVDKKEGDDVVVRTPGGERAFEVISIVTLHERSEAKEDASK